MPQLIWSKASLDDIEKLYCFLEKKNKKAAQKAIQVIRQTVGLIQSHPHIGKPIEYMENEYREWIVSFGASGYVVLYHFDGNKTVILSVKHQKEVGYPPCR